MKTLEIELPDALAEELEELVKAGWFTNENEIGRLALAEFVNRHRFKLQEHFQREDIAWAFVTRARSRLRRVVSDTGPVLHLFEAGCLELL
jgi:Arc/MetJ-type ribon-helix-helix transcriptional regulator